MTAECKTFSIAKMFHNRLTPIYVLSSAFLLWPIDCLQNRLYLSLLHYVTPTVLFVVYTYFFIASVHLITKFDYPNSDELVKIVDLSISGGSISMFYFIHVYNIIKRFEIKRIAVDVQEACEGFWGISEAGPIETYKEISILLALFLTYTSIEGYIYETQVAFYGPSNHFVFTYPIFLAVLHIYTISAMLRTYKSLYFRMNDELRRLNGTGGLRGRLGAIAAKHVRIVKQAYRLNDYFGFLFLFFIAFAFCSCVVYIKYILTTVYTVLLKNKELDVTLAVWNFIWLVLVNLVLFVTVYYWVSLRDEV